MQVEILFVSSEVMGRVAAALEKIEKRLSSIEAKVGVLMGQAQTFNDLLVQLDAATNAVAARLNTISQQLANGLSADEAAPIVAQLQTEVAHLQSLGASPGNPIPPAVVAGTPPGTSGETPPAPPAGP